MSGRWSPINSPARSRQSNSGYSPRGDSKSLLSSDDNDIGLPPSYDQDDKSTPSRASRSSDAYSNLLNFLDNAAVTDLSHSHNEHRDDISTMSNSMASPQRGQRAFGTKKYVWDELPKDSLSASSYHEGESLTYFKAPSYSNGENQSVSSASSLQSNIEEVRAKVEAMKAELRSRQQVVKELQSEHTRLKAAASECTAAVIKHSFYIVMFWRLLV